MRSPKPGTSSQNIEEMEMSDESESDESMEISNSSDLDDDCEPEKKKGWKNGIWVLEENGENEDVGQINENEEENNEEEEEMSDEEQETIEKFKKKQIHLYDPYAKLDLELFNHATNEALNRAEEYMKLYLLRYKSGHIIKDMARRMLFAAYLYSAPAIRLFIHQEINDHGVPSLFYQPINLRRFFRTMDKLESQIGALYWDFFYISGQHFLIDQIEGQQTESIEHFTIKLLKIIRQLHKMTMRLDWPMVAECIANIPLIHPKFHQHYGPFYFEYLSRTLGPYLPQIYLTALQCLLESKESIFVLGKQFVAVYNAFMTTTKTPERSFWRDQALFYYSNLLTFHLANLHLDRPKRSEEDWLSLTNQIVHKYGSAEHRRMISLLNYCVEFERYFYEINNGIIRTEGKLNKIQDRTLANSFDYFLAKLMEEPRKALGLLPLAVWCAKEFDRFEELKTVLFEQCAIYPYLLINVHNILARFQLDEIAGYLLGELFELSVEILSTTHFVLDLVEQRSLDPTSYGQLDSIVSGNLRALFMFLDYGRNRTDERAWALLYSNICYIKENEELVNALIKPFWETRKSWWPKFHQINRLKLPRKSTQLRRQVFDFLHQL